MNENNKLVDILKPRNTQFGIFRFMTRTWIPKRALALDKCYTPQELKDSVMNSVFMDTILNAESSRQGIEIETLRKEVAEYLDEMAFEKKLHVVRWIGIAFLKICFMMRIGVNVNESVVHKLKESMGNSPVLFLPTHRSYADFCLMTYLCFHYDIDIPAVAAGMDFMSMAVVGQRMREMCAFYIRRSLVGAPLYAATLKQYVRTLIAKHSAPFEFFIEGTRSRSNKSLPPKIGLLSMTLLPYFSREVTDMTIVPVNITYDRLLELPLFAYEHLGVPKPPESTEGLLKSLQSLNDNYGNIYINLGSPISLNEYFNRNVPNTSETLKPVDLQELTREQQSMVQKVANRVVASQQECTMVTVPTLLSVVLMESLIRNRTLHLDDLVKEVEWLVSVFSARGACVVEGDLKAGIDRMLVVHRRMFTLDGDKQFKLVSSPLINITSEFQKKMKGHKLKTETILNSVPIIEVQAYVNSVLHYLVPPALVFLITRSGVGTPVEAYQAYRLLRGLLRFEYFYVDKCEKETYLKAVEYCIENGVVSRDGDSLIVGTEEKLQYLFEWVLLPALVTLTYIMDIMAQVGRAELWQLLRLVQERAEQRLEHPYCLSLISAGYCLSGVNAAGALIRIKGEKDIIFETVDDVMSKCREAVRSVLPQIRADFGAGNCVIAGRSPVASRL